MHVCWGGRGDGSDVIVVQMVQGWRGCDASLPPASSSRSVNSIALIRSGDDLGVLAASSWSS